MSEENKAKVKIHFHSDPEEVSLAWAPVEKSGKANASYVNGIEGKDDSYEGEFSGGMRHGQGTYVFGNPDANNAKYTGSFAGVDVAEVTEEENKKAGYHGGLPHGEGTFNYPDGSSYIGLFSQGKKHGQGVYTYANGDVYCGEFANDLKHGNGIYTCKSNMSQLIGNFVNGSLTEGGTWKLADGTTYTGGFNNNTPNGVGSWKFTNGNKLAGRHEVTANNNIVWVPTN